MKIEQYEKARTIVNDIQQYELQIADTKSKINKIKKLFQDKVGVEISINKIDGWQEVSLCWGVLDENITNALTVPYERTIEMKKNKIKELKKELEKI